MTKVKHRKHVDRCAKAWTNFMLETLVGIHLGAAGVNDAPDTVVAKRMIGKELLSYWGDVEQILAFNNCWPLTGRTADMEAFLELVSQMEFYHSLTHFGLKLGRRSDGYGDVIEFQPVNP